MLFVRTQSVLKRVLPESWFNFVYRVASRLYGVWSKVSDRLFYLIRYAYYSVKGDASNARKMKRICSILPYTLVGRSGLLITYELASDIERSEKKGSFVECGVAQGGCSALMAMVASDHESKRQVWLFDSFEGLPDPTVEDMEDVVENPGGNRHSNDLHKGYCLGTYEAVELLLFSKLNLKRNNIHLVEGWFKDTLPKNKDEVGDISFLRLDGDWYESTKCCLENLYDSVISQGYIFIDDYSLAGCRQAVDEFLEKKKVNVELTFDNRGGCYFVKP